MVMALVSSVLGMTGCSKKVINTTAKPKGIVRKENTLIDGRVAEIRTYVDDKLVSTEDIPNPALEKPQKEEAPVEVTKPDVLEKSVNIPSETPDYARQEIKDNTKKVEKVFNEIEKFLVSGKYNDLAVKDDMAKVREFIINIPMDGMRQADISVNDTTGHYVDAYGYSRGVTHEGAYDYQLKAEKEMGKVVIAEVSFDGASKTTRTSYVRKIELQGNGDSKGKMVQFQMELDVDIR